MADGLTVEGDEVSGEVSLAIPPGTTAKEIDRLLGVALGDALDRVASELSVVLATYPSRYARPLPGKTEDGKMRYAVRARREGGKLLPAHNPMHSRG